MASAIFGLFLRKNLALPVIIIWAGLFEGSGRCISSLANIMQQIGVWHVITKGPQKLSAGQVELEHELEEWIEKDPGLLGAGLTIIGRQLRLESGKLDLLGLDLQGSLVVIEVKKGMVGRDSVAQVFDYASSIASMDMDELVAKVDEYLSTKTPKTTLSALMDQRGFDLGELDKTRDVRMFVVGTGEQQGLVRLVQFLSKFQIPFSIVCYGVFEVDGSQRILIRELHEYEIEPLPAKRSKISFEQLCLMAEQYGVEEQFRLVRAATERHNLYPRLWASSIMYTPISNHTRMLFTVWTKPRTKHFLKVFVGADAFPEFFPVKVKEVRQHLGPDGWREMSKDDVQKFVEGLDRLFSQIENS